MSGFREIILEGYSNTGTEPVCKEAKYFRERVLCQHNVHCDSLSLGAVVVDGSSLKKCP